ncbi:MAG: TolB family protein [Bradymonadia bacterium]
MSRILFFVFALMVSIPTAAVAEMSVSMRVASRPAAHCLAPRWSPDGKKLAVDVFEPKRDARETWIIEIDDAGRSVAEAEVTSTRGRASSRLGGSKAPVVELAWAPSMKLLNRPYVFSSRSPRKNFDLFADGAWLTENLGNDGQPHWSADGRYIAYASQQSESGDIFLLDLQSQSYEPQRVTLWPNATEFRPRWSPTKNFLVFTRSQEGKKGQDIGVVADVLRPADSTRMVTSWDGDEIRPSWSPDGTQVAFYSNRDQPDNRKLFDLWVIGVDGKGAKKLDSDVVVDDYHGPAWTPDGSVVLYVKRDFKENNPVRWVSSNGASRGLVDTGTQMNSDLAVIGDGKRVKLAFRALGLKGSTDKVWQRVYVTTFSMSDLKR